MQKCWNPGFVSGDILTSLFTDLSQAPHGVLLCVVRLAGVAGRRSDALISNSVEVWRLQGLIWAVAPQVLSHTNVKLLGKGLTECSDTKWYQLQFARRLNIQWRRFNKETAGPLRVDPPGLWSWCCCSRHPGFGSSDSAPRLRKCSQQRGRCNRRHRCPQGPQSQTDTGKVPYSGCSSQPAAKTHTLLSTT